MDEHFEGRAVWIDVIKGVAAMMYVKLSRKLDCLVISGVIR